jgi:EAL domain-containing protein (putative c-di-GMP-specific phosphodiesterase class I)
LNHDDAEGIARRIALALLGETDAKALAERFAEELSRHTHVAVLARRGLLQPQILAAVGLGHPMSTQLEVADLTLGLGVDLGEGRGVVSDLLGRVGRALRLAELSDGSLEEAPARPAPAEPSVEQGLASIHNELQLLALGAEAPEHRFGRYLACIDAAVGQGAESGLLVSELGSSLSQGVRDLETAIVDDDVNRIGRILQRLKPSLKLVGEAALAEATYTIERCARLVRSVHEGLEPGTGIDTTLAHLTRHLSDVWRRIVEDLTSVEPQRPAFQPSLGLRPLLPGLRALVADDEPFARRLVEEMLKTLGATSVTTVEDGAAALTALTGTTSYELVLCDLSLPVVDGIELLRKLGEMRFSGSVIIMSSAGSRVLMSVDELARQHGLSVLGTLQKPFECNNLEVLLKMRRAADRPSTGTTEIGAMPLTALDVEEAIRTGEIGTHFQPKVDATTLEMIGVEVLARWYHDDGSQTQPHAFVRVAEHHGLSDLLFEAILDQTLATARRLNGIHPTLRFAVNVSARSLVKAETFDIVRGRLERAGLAPSRLILEVTETGLVQDLKIALGVLNRLRLLGVGLSIDDFGTGYSSIDLLRRAPFDELKIDRSFVANAVRDPSARHIIASSVSMAKGLGLRVTAEGVENRDELALVRSLGCDEIQGYLVARPMPEASLERLLLRGGPVTTL